jgi:cysteine desulfurase / selenocysteine lyase
METDRRGFLQRLSRVALVAASPLILDQDGNGGTRENSLPLGKQKSLGLDTLRAQFPLLEEKVNGHPLVYLDSAATTQRPLTVLDAIANFYLCDNANPAKSLHTIAGRAATLYEEAKETVARFVHARGPQEIVWTRGTTEAINLVASSWGGANLRSGDEIVLTVSEHYSSLVPWQLAARRASARIRYLDVEENGRLRVNQLDTLLSARTKLVALTHVSNVLGAINPVKEICERAHRVGALVLVDGAQSVPHFSVNVRELCCDFLAFSGHKMMGPMGIGVLWARQEILDGMPPYQTGSNMTHEVDLESASTHFAKGALKFEAGTPNVPGAVGLAAAVEFLDSLGRGNLWAREQELTQYALSRFKEVKGLRILGPIESRDRVSVFSFVIENRQVPDVVKALDGMGVAIRGGDLASLPLLKRMGVSAAARASCYAYTSHEEIDQLIVALQEYKERA